MKLKPVDTAVRLIEKSMKGIGTDECNLTIAILRYQGLIGSICPAYENADGKSLKERVRGELRGDFEKLVVEMISYRTGSD